MVRIIRRKMPDSAAGRSQCLTEELVSAACRIAISCEATALFIPADALRNRWLRIADEVADRLCVVHTSDRRPDSAPRGARSLRLPNVPLTRMGQIKLALFAALTRGIVRRGDVIVSVSGPPASGTVDTLAVIDGGHELNSMLPLSDGDLLPATVQPEVAERVVSLAAELGSEGREGKPVGAMFVVGDTQRVHQHSRPLILNPFQGYREEERNLLDPRLEDSIKELSSLDGAFVVRGDGIVESCGACLEAAPERPPELPPGLGARHHAAAAITAVADCLAVTVSESNGTVSVFRRGRIVTSLKRPRGVEVRRG